MFVKIFILLLLVTEVATLMCYQCRDSSGETGKNHCGRWVRTMNKYRQRHLETGKIDLPFVKNCSGFHNLSSADIYCAIMKVELGGEVRSYIRGCSDGKDFFSADYNDDVRRYIRTDNQSYCIYTGQGFVACASVCNTDFCNGYVSSAWRLDLSCSLLFMSCLLYLYFNIGRNVLHMGP